MSEYSRRNLACSSWHHCPEGWQSWTGHVNGYTTRPFCRRAVGHPGPHEAAIETVGEMEPAMVTVHGLDGSIRTEKELVPKHKLMSWPNNIGIPLWLTETTEHGLRMVREHLYGQDQTACEELDEALDVVDRYLQGWPGRVEEMIP
jgi:hypothetical protein